MRNEKPRIATLFAFALIAVVGTALSMEMDRTGTATGTGTSAPASEVTRAALLPAANLCQQVDLVEPAAACRIRPECSTNSDCDEQCGVGLGRCVHSNCPVRICRCG